MILDASGQCVDRKIMEQRFIYANIVVLHMLARWDEQGQRESTAFSSKICDDAFEIAFRILR